MNVPWSPTLAVTPLTVIMLVDLTPVLVNLVLLPMVHFAKVCQTFPSCLTYVSPPRIKKNYLKRNLLCLEINLEV